MEITGKIDTERAATVGIITYDNPEDEVNASLDELVGLLGVLKLLADSNAASVPYEPWEIDIECMVWESCHGVAF